MFPKPNKKNRYFCPWKKSEMRMLKKSEMRMLKKSEMRMLKKREMRMLSFKFPVRAFRA